MKPTLLQRFFASKGLFWAWFSATSLGACLVGLCIGGFRFEYLGQVSMVGRYLLIVAIATPLGFMLGFFPGMLLLSSLLYVRALVNGGPFKVGDRVQLIGGDHDGVVTTIYSKWRGSAFRADLGVEAKKNFKDIVLPTQMLKVTSEKKN